MAGSAVILPGRRPGLLLSPLGEEGHVLKDLATGDYYSLGPREAFLLEQLNGEQTPEAVRAAFEAHFGEPLSQEALWEFIELARDQGFLQTAARIEATPSPPPPAGEPAQGALCWRKCLFDPDRLFTRLAPKVWFCWTPAFLLFSTGCILLAAALAWANRGLLASSFAHALRWETVALVWLTLLVVTLLHEFAHGLTCKHYGGEVHEVGVLFLYLVPCFYCDVSDAWLFKERSKRLWVTFAGGYFELFLWALAAFAWRLTQPDTLVNYLAFVVLSVCGVQTLFNFNPLLKLDGYYLLSDWQGIPNLHPRSFAYLKAHLRWLLWGAARPARDPRGRFLLLYGSLAWLFSLGFLVLVLAGLFTFCGTHWGWAGYGLVALLGMVTTRGQFRDLAAGEVTHMLRLRRKRAVGWLVLLGAAAAALCLVEIEDWAGGSFQVRSASRAELRAPVAGFLQDVYADEGDRVSPGGLVVRLEVPDLASRLAQKRAEVQEAQARLRMLEKGPRYEEVAEQRSRVNRARGWRDLARQDLRRERQALEHELAQLEKLVAQYQAELEAAQDAYERNTRLIVQGASAGEQHRDVERRYKVCKAQLEQAQAKKRAREAGGVLAAEAELARRERELADARAALRLLELGARPEEIDAEQARVRRLQEEMGYLESLRNRVHVRSPVAGLVATQRLKERRGEYVREGDLICVVEGAAALEAEVILAEQDATRVRAGQVVRFKARALPYETFQERLARVAPVAARGEAQGTMSVYCELPAPPSGLRPGMTGFARVQVGRRPVGAVLLDRVLRFLRTEFWW
ncbi:MAG: efflux RND transporter periplasmic adaptor subunit [Planctomycetes bacterium]|nr:efflux RND transporter periplasmic adaptor subunit [Planctomycetota bacterium]